MKKKIIILTVFFAISIGSLAQTYRTSAGVRGAFVSGISVKHFIDDHAALEGILSAGVWGGGLTGLYELHAPAFDVKHLYWYYGGGGHLATWNSDFPGVDYKEGSHMVIGLDGILGLEYEIEEIPITISADWKPTFNLTGYPGFWGYGGAISIRYTFH
jgi:hypothetical protein